jgi:hypothetical protein
VHERTKFCVYCDGRLINAMHVESSYEFYFASLFKVEPVASDPVCGISEFRTVYAAQSNLMSSGILC